MSTVEKICVTGIFSITEENRWVRKLVQFDYTFPREPTVSASLSYVYTPGGTYSKAYASVERNEITSSSAVIIAFKIAPAYFCSVTWIACL